MSELAAQVGQLIGFGLQPKLAPGRELEYRDLVACYLNESEFRDAFERTAAGMGLEVLHCSVLQGMVLAASAAGSPFRLRLDEFAQMSARDRHRYGIVFLVIAAASYPRAEMLDDEGGPLTQVSVEQLVRYLNRLATRVAEERAALHDPDPPSSDPLRQRLYQAVLSWADTAATADQRSNPRQKSGMIRRALNWLAANRCADEVAPDSYRMRGRFRLLVKDAIAAMPADLGTASVGDALKLIRHLGEEETA